MRDCARRSRREFASRGMRWRNAVELFLVENPSCARASTRFRKLTRRGEMQAPVFLAAQVWSEWRRFGGYASSSGPTAWPGTNGDEEPPRRRFQQEPTHCESTPA